MTFEQETDATPTPVKGWLDRVRQDGTTEHIDLTVDEVRDAPNHYTGNDLGDIKVEFSNGAIARPFRFCATSVEITYSVDPETGKTISHHY